MKKFLIKKPKKDFNFIEFNYNIKGTRQKRIVIDKIGKKAFFKYEHFNYLCSEACSEKLCYEIAKIINYDCAKIEIAVDEEGNLGVLNYLFLNSSSIEHIDAIAYLNKDNHERKDYYKISNIKKSLDELDSTLFNDFIKIMIFDALVGEQDRHEENWGITKEGNKYKISPLYDNGCSLLRDFKDENYAKEYYSNRKDFDSFINKSKTYIYKETENKRYKHFELIKYLNKTYNNEVQKEIKKLNKLTDKKIEKIVNKIPDNLITLEHKKFIIMYLIKRRNILLSIK